MFLHPSALPRQVDDRSKMLLELRQLKYVVIATESPSFRQAAHSLRVRQVTLSKRILLLEQRLGVTLFERTRLPLRLALPSIPASPAKCARHF